ncbi:hypothetical protein LTR62_002280 [Meristemomyces frigidus]|uniref:Uncharacterized protein n=1 Tax=Meristemomyces frigidus TaxID=1508187 RepID=A0AAN7TFV0_9PEZI|nr:hypothetical protein LTR62_002280 [Meristemomyces frigidus]
MAARFSAAIRTATLAKPTTTLLRSSIAQQTQRSFQTSRQLRQDGVIARRPVGAFRGTLFGFLLGSVLAGGGLYYYVVDEYKVGNELLTEDIYALQAAVQRLEGYVKSLEGEVKANKK